MEPPALPCGHLLPGPDPVAAREGGEDLFEGGEEVARFLLGAPLGKEGLQDVEGAWGAMALPLRARKSLPKASCPLCPRRCLAMRLAWFWSK